MAGRFTARRVAVPDLPAVEEAQPSALEGVAWTVFPEAPSEPAPPPVQQAANPLHSDKLLDAGALRQPMAEVLAAAVKARITTIISGGTGSGKTTMLNALSGFISEKERLITIEDAAAST